MTIIRYSILNFFLLSISTSYAKIPLDIEIYFFNKEPDWRSSSYIFEPNEKFLFYKSKFWEDTISNLGYDSGAFPDTALFNKVVYLSNENIDQPNALGIYYNKNTVSEYLQKSRVVNVSIRAFNYNNHWANNNENNWFSIMFKSGVFPKNLIELDLTETELSSSAYHDLSQLINLKMLVMPLKSDYIDDTKFQFPENIEELTIYNARIDVRLGEKLGRLTKLRRLVLIDCSHDLSIPESVNHLNPLTDFSLVQSSDGIGKLNLHTYDPLGYIRNNIKELVIINGSAQELIKFFTWNNLKTLTINSWVPYDFLPGYNRNANASLFPSLQKINILLHENDKDEVVNERILKHFAKSISWTNMPSFKIVNEYPMRSKLPE